MGYEKKTVTFVTTSLLNVFEGKLNNPNSLALDIF